MIPKDPSVFSMRFLLWFCPKHLHEGIEGDLLEKFDMDLEQLGYRSANRRFLWGVIRFFRPSILLRNNTKLNLINTIMLGNYFKITARSMMKSKLYSFINAFGLSIGMAFCMLIFLYIQDENSFDKTHANGPQLYRMEAKMINTWEMYATEDPFTTMAHLQLPLRNVLKEELSQVAYATRYNTGSDAVVTYSNKVFSEKITFVDADFFQMFSFELLEGSKDKIFADLHEAVITPRIAKKYFGDESPINKVISIDRGGVNSYTITGVIEEAPENSSFKFDFLLRTENRPYFKRNNENWGNFNTPTFVMLQEGTDMASFDKGLDDLVEKYMADNIKRWDIAEELLKSNKAFEYKYTPLLAMHLDTDVPWHKGSDAQYSLILGAIAILILAIACINYVSLALTTSKSRRIEVGVRKAIGAQRSQVIYQFTFESILLAMVSMLFGLGIMKLFLPAFNVFTDKAITISAATAFELLGLGVLVSIVVGIIAGSYPSFVLSQFKPAEVLKPSFSGKLKGGFTRPLVIIQFALSAFLIVSSIIMYQQMSFITSKDLGYNQEQVLVVPTQTGWNDKGNQAVAQMRQALATSPQIASVSGTSTSFSNGYSLHGYEIKGEERSAFGYAVDSEYISTLDITLLQGRNFDPTIVSDSTAIIVNEALVEDMGWDNPLEEHLNWREDSIGLGAKVIGVVKNYHFRSLEHEIQPMMMSMDKDAMGYLTSILIKVNTNDLPQAVALVKDQWMTLFPDRPFDFRFLDEDIDKQYESYTQWMNIMGLSTLFAILISSLGLFGLSGVNALNRTKEIGIRRVMGAELTNIFYLLNKQYVWLAVIAFGVASPVSYYVMTIWLSDFEFAITIGWEIFAMSMVVGLLVALTTVSYHALKTASVNPAETLKHE